MRLGDGSELAPPENRSAPGSGSQRVRRVLCCGVHDYRDIRMFHEALATADGDVDFVSLHTTDPEIVEEYRRRFSPDFVVLANEGASMGTAGIHRLRTVVDAAFARPKPETAMADRLKLERPLTERQIEVLQYLRNGCTNRKIAEYMCVQPRTVKDWLKQLFLLFFVSNRTELVARVIDLDQTSSAQIRESNKEN